MKLADILTWSRLFLIIPISIAVISDARIAALVLFVSAQLTDFFDGKVARWTRTASKRGAMLDSRVDSIFVFFLIAWVLWLFPSLIPLYWPWVAAIVCVKTLELCVARWKIGSYTGLHVYSQKFCAFLGALLLPVLIIFGEVHWFIMGTVVLAILGQLEAIIYFLRGGKDLDAKWFLSPLR